VSSLPPTVARFRASYREEEIGPRYRGWGHFCFTTFGSLAAIAFAASRLRNVHGFEWAMIPISFLLANFGEYLGHRGPMHRPRPPLEIVYKRHTQQHHHFFTDEAMVCETSRDFKMVLFPPVLLIFFLGCLATPIGALLYFVISPNAGWLFAIVAVGYFLTYEWLHFAYHQPETSWVARLPFMPALRLHHTRHHDLALMGKYNFNITFPIADLVLGTLYREDTQTKTT
jgi:hypothetical protein